MKTVARARKISMSILFLNVKRAKAVNIVLQFHNPNNQGIIFNIYQGEANIQVKTPKRKKLPRI